MPTLMICLSVKNPRFSLSHPLSGIKASVSSMSSSGKDLTVDNNTIPHSFPKMVNSKYFATHTLTDTPSNGHLCNICSYMLVLTTKNLLEQINNLPSIDIFLWQIMVTFQ